MQTENAFLEYVKTILDYDSETGEFKWKVSNGRRVQAGDIAGGDDGNRYRRIGILGTNYLAHRLAWLITYGRWPKDQLDHINRDKSDNRIANLRECSTAENGQNQKLHSRNTSGFKGVSFDANAMKWKAQIKKNCKCHNLGYFNSPEEASEAYKRAKRELHKFNPEVA